MTPCPLCRDLGLLQPCDATYTLDNGIHTVRSWEVVCQNPDCKFGAGLKPTADQAEAQWSRLGTVPNTPSTEFTPWEDVDRYIKDMLDRIDDNIRKEVAKLLLTLGRDEWRK